MSAAEQYFPLKLFILLYKLAVTFESVEKDIIATIRIKAIVQLKCAVRPVVQ